MVHLNNNIDKLKSILSDKYESVELIASGGMGEIYLAIHRALGQKRAIKIIHQTVEKEKDIRKRFLHEAQLAASIDHPGIIQILDFGSDEDFDYLIMPYIDGATLQEKLETGVYQWNQYLKMMIPMADAISHTHKNDIIHRDIKPANFIIDAQERIILTDFGISKNMGDIEKTAANTILGSPQFMSPEQITGKEVDKRCDLYSLGMVFYQMVTGEYAFASDDAGPLMYKQVHEIPVHPSDVKSDVPREFGDIIMKLLAKEPDDRFPDGEALVRSLKKTIAKYSSESGTERDTNFHEMATRILRPLQNTIIKQKPMAKGSPSLTIVKTKLPAVTDKKRIWFISAAGILILGLFFIFISTMVQKSQKDPVIHKQIQTPSLQKTHMGIQSSEVQPVEAKESLVSTVTLRSKMLKENELIENYEKVDIPFMIEDVKELLKLKIGYDQAGDVDPQSKSVMVSFLKSLPFICLAESGGCDILILQKKYAFGRKISISSNLYECESNCTESFIISTNQLPLNKIERILQRNYCFNAFSSLAVIGAKHNGGGINIVVPGKINNTFILGEAVKFCMHPDFESHCMLLDINIDGIYKLFPISGDQHHQLGKAEEQCSIDITVSPPIGNEMIAAIGVKQKALISDYSLQFDPQKLFIKWPLVNGIKKNTVNFSVQLFLNLVQVPPEHWSVKSKFIQVIGSN